MIAAEESAHLIAWPSPWALASILVLVVVNGAFVALEFALVSLRGPRAEALARSGRGRRRYQWAADATNELGTMLAGAQLAVTIASLVLGMVGEPAVSAVLERVVGGIWHLPESVLRAGGFAVALALVAFLHILFGEMVPKNLALAEPEATLLVLAGPLRLWAKLVAPVLWVLAGLARLGSAALGVTPTDEFRSTATPAQLELMLADAHHAELVGAAELERMQGALRLVRRRVEEVMVPLERMVTVAAGVSLAEAERVISESGHSRLVVTDAAGGEPVGFIHAKDLLAGGLSQDPARPLPAAWIREAVHTDVGSPLGPLMTELPRRRCHLALVRGEGGRVVGLVTLEDVLEAVVGDITDETDPVPGPRQATGPADHSELEQPAVLRAGPASAGRAD